MSPSIRENRERAAELKFLVTPAVAEQVRAWARRHLLPDPHAGGFGQDQYQITSLYFDTPEFDVFNKRDSYGRAKFRVRRYGEESVVYLERKLRTRRMLAKRRSPLPLAELERLSGPSLAPGEPAAWFQRRLELRRLRPVCQVRYLRTARVAMTANGPVRLTLDEGLGACAAHDFAFREAGLQPILPHRIVLEMKFVVCMPVMFKSLIAEFALNLAPFSKYRHAATALGLAAPAGHLGPVPETSAGSLVYA